MSTMIDPPPEPSVISKSHHHREHKHREMLNHIRATAPPLLHRIQSGLSKLPVELVWAAHSQWPLQEGQLAKFAQSTRPLRISILDSSFNPPTLAHLALANSCRPKYSNELPGAEYDAKLLLLSVKNVDKTLRPGDATYLQRLEMMALLAQDVQTDIGDNNVAIAIVDEPTFVGKSKVLQEYFRTRLAILQTPAQAQLSFIIGMDTLERLFSPRYYPPPPLDPTATAEETMVSVLTRMLSPQPDGDDSLIVCAKRATVPVEATPNSILNRLLSHNLDWMKPDESIVRVNDNSIPRDERIVLINIGERESKFSSTAVRNARGRVDIGGLGSGGSQWEDWVTTRVANYIEEEKLYIS